MLEELAFGLHVIRDAIDQRHWLARERPRERVGVREVRAAVRPEDRDLERCRVTESRLQPVRRLRPPGRSSAGARQSPSRAAAVARARHSAGKDQQCRGEHEPRRRITVPMSRFTRADDSRHGVGSRRLRGGSRTARARIARCRGRRRGARARAHAPIAVERPRRRRPSVPRALVGDGGRQLARRATCSCSRPGDPASACTRSSAASCRGGRAGAALGLLSARCPRWFTMRSCARWPWWRGLDAPPQRAVDGGARGRGRAALPPAVRRGWVAGLAALIYAIDDGHGFAVGWLANRCASWARASRCSRCRSRPLAPRRLASGRVSARSVRARARVLRADGRGARLPRRVRDRARPRGPPVHGAGAVCRAAAAGSRSGPRWVRQRRDRLVHRPFAHPLRLRERARARADPRPQQLGALPADLWEVLFVRRGLPG